MEKTLGERIAAIRKAEGLTQEELAEKLSVSGQAVSKWENNLTCPDITLLPALARLGGITVDELLTGEQKPETVLVPVEQRKSIDELMLRIVVDSAGGDKVRVNLPLSIVKIAVDAGLSMDDVTANVKGLGNINIDFNKLFLLAEKGMMGKLVEVESADGDIVHIFVE
ncbi:MAG: helix-turn-helix domain-containing protein [Oscillospiraceae bacterium]